MPILIISDLVVRINASTTHASRWRERLSRNLTFACPKYGGDPFINNDGADATTGAAHFARMPGSAIRGDYIVVTRSA